MSEDVPGTVMVCESGCCIAQLNDDERWQTLDREQPGRTWQYDREHLIGKWTVIFRPEAVRQ